MHFQSGGFDLGIFDQTVWQYAHFLTPFNTIKGEFILGDHLTLTMPLLAPLYWIWSDVRILLIFQAVFITLSSVADKKIFSFCFFMFKFYLQHFLGNSICGIF
jgi:uncharacterized membrane protein